MNYSTALQFYVRLSRRVLEAADLLGNFRRLATFGLGHTSGFLFGEGGLAYCPEHPVHGRKGTSKAVCGRAYCSVLRTHTGYGSRSQRNVYPAPGELENVDLRLSKCRRDVTSIAGARIKHASEIRAHL